MPDLKFSRHHRLCDALAFESVFKANEFKVAHPNYLILARYNNRPNARLGLVVSKKNIPTAIARNRMKRVVRESFRNSAGLTALDIVFLVRSGVGLLSRREINLLLLRAWGRLAQKCCKNENSNAILADLTD